MHSTDPAPGTVYLIHFDIAYKHARHYIGWTLDLDARVQAHLNGHGARLIEVINDAGIPWRVARTWPGSRDRERAIKARHAAPRLCPACSPHPQPVTRGRSAALPATPPVTAIVAALHQASPRDSGTRMGEQFLAQRDGWTADQIQAAYDYVTGPYRELARHTAAQQERHRAFTDVITAYLAQLRAGMPPRALRADGESAAITAGGYR
jgi:predicted GIY-YIG superfamily endonuclease